MHKINLDKLTSEVYEALRMRQEKQARETSAMTLASFIEEIKG